MQMIFPPEPKLFQELSPRHGMAIWRAFFVAGLILLAAAMFVGGLRFYHALFDAEPIPPVEVPELPPLPPVEHTAPPPAPPIEKPVEKKPDCNVKSEGQKGGVTACDVGTINQ